MSLLRNTITSSHWHLAQVPCHRLHWPGLIPEQRCEPPCHALSFRRAWHIWHVIFFLLKIKTGLTKPTRHRTCLVCHKFEEIVLSKKKTFLRKNELMREISLQQSFQISLPRVMPQPAPAPRMWTAWTRFVEKVGQSALGSADASDVSI